MAEEPREMSLTLKSQLLFRPLHYMGYSLPDPSAKFELYDRVVNVRDGISVPLGLKGVVIGKHVDEENEVNTVYDVLFDEEFVGGVALRCSPGRGYKMSAANLMNISYGRTKSHKSKQIASNFTALQPATTPKVQKNYPHLAPKSARKVDQEASSRRNGSGQEFAGAVNGAANNAEDQKPQFQRTARFVAPNVAKQRSQGQQSVAYSNGIIPNNAWDRNLLLGKQNQVDPSLGSTPRPNRVMQPPPAFIPAQVSRQQRSGGRGRTPQAKGGKQKAGSPPSAKAMMTVEMLEQEMMKSEVPTPSCDPAIGRKPSVKKRLAINL